MHSGIAIDLLALDASARARQIKRHSERRSGQASPRQGQEPPASQSLGEGVGARAMAWAWAAGSTLKAKG